MGNLTENSNLPTERAATVASASAAGDHGERPHDLLAMQRAVVAMGRRAIASPEVSVLMQDAANLLAEMLNVEHGGVAELSADGMQLCRRFASLGEKEAEPEIVTDPSTALGSDSLAGYVLQVAHPVVVADLPRENRFGDLFLRRRGIRSAVAAPLKLQDRSFGALAAYSKQIGYFDENDLLFVETIAHLVATTIARAHAEARAERAEAAVQQAQAVIARLSAAGSVADQPRTPPAGPADELSAGPLRPIPGGVNAERRRRTRRSYPYTQVIAPVIDGKLPSQDRFYSIKCRDIAAGGFSFLATQPPAFETFVVALGVPPKITHLMAQVAHVTRTDEDGQRMFLIGCNYTGRAPSY